MCLNVILRVLKMWWDEVVGFVEGRGLWKSVVTERGFDGKIT